MECRFESHPHGMVINGSAFNNTLVFKYSNLIGTLWSNIGEISVEKGVRKYQLWKKRNGDEYELLESDYKSDLNSSDIDTKSVNNEFRTYFDKNSLKIISRLASKNKVIITTGIKPFRFLNELENAIYFQTSIKK